MAMAKNLARVAKWLVGTRSGRYTLGGVAVAGLGAEGYRKFRQHVLQPLDDPMGYSQIRMQRQERDAIKALRQEIRGRKRLLKRRPGVPPYFYGPMGPYGPYQQ